MIRFRVTAVSITCGLLFAIFSFVYLWIGHGDTLSSLYAGYSTADASYSPMVGALLVTLILWMLQVVVNLFTRFHRMWQAVSFFPSYFCLGLLTCLKGDNSSGVFYLTFDWSWWQFLFGGAFFALLVYLHRRFAPAMPEKEEFSLEAIPNLITLSLFSCMTGYIGNNNELFRYESAVSHAISQGDTDRALAIGEKSLGTSHTLSTLRIYALSQADSLSQRLFCYPQVGLRGVFFNEEKGVVSAITNAAIYDYLGGIPRKRGETVPFYLRRVCRSDSTNRKAVDYYLSALLLERQLETFTRALAAFYGNSRPIGRHYQEALLLYCKRVPEYEAQCREQISPEVRQRFKLFGELQAQELHPQVERNYAYRRFGDTYWSYFWYVE